MLWDPSHRNRFYNKSKKKNTTILDTVLKKVGSTVFKRDKTSTPFSLSGKEV